MTSKLPALLAAGALALSATACGENGADGADEAAVEAAETEEPAELDQGSLLDVFRNLTTSTQEVSNYRIDIDIETHNEDFAQEFGEAMEISMAILVMDDPQAVQTTMEVPFLGEMMLGLAEVGGTDVAGLTAEDLGTSTYISLGDGQVLASDPHGLQAPTPWVRTGGGAEEFAMDPEDFFSLEDMSDSVGAFAAIESVEQTGTEEVNGVPTTVIEGSMTQEEIAALGDPEQRAAMEDLVGGDVQGTMHVKIWADRDGFPMRMEFSDAEASMRMEFSDIGSTSFEIPGEDEITDL